MRAYAAARCLKMADSAARCPHPNPLQRERGARTSDFPDSPYTSSSLDSQAVFHCARCSRQMSRPLATVASGSGIQAHGHAGLLAEEAIEPP